MTKTKKWTLVSVVSALAVAAVAGVWLFGSTAVANAAGMTPETLKTITQPSTGPGLLGEGYLNCGGWGRGGFRGIDYNKLLADALGISVEKLQAAYEEARTAAIEEAVKQGLITREQADEMLVWGGFGKRGFGFRPGPKGVPSGKIDEEALLAKALNITVDQLQAAREKANLAAIEAAVEKGIITREQADEMLAGRKLQSYLEQDTLLAKALGMTAEQLKAAYAEGKTLSALMSERKLDAATVRKNLTAAYSESLAQAVKDGVITQEQADQMKNGRGMGFSFPGGPGGPGGSGGRGGFRGHGGMGMRGPGTPNTDDSTKNGIRRPGPGMRMGSAL
jgi:formaldehyde-activating enzyme involved in methanogenesis